MVSQPNTVAPATTGDSDSEASSFTIGHGSHLLRVKDTLPPKLWVVAIIGFWERATFWGLTAPWQNYMENPRHYDSDQTPGALDLGQVTATRIYCGFFILYFTVPIFIAPLADNVLGQYKTLLLGMLVYCTGCVVLTVSSLPINLDRGWGLPGMILAIALIGLGGGGSQATMRSFIANQYTDRKPKVMTRKHKQVITDSELTLEYIYQVYFWVGNVGALFAFATVYIEKQHGFAPAYGLGLGCLVIAILMLLAGKRWYVKADHTDDVMIPALKVLICAARNGFKMKNADPDYQLAKCAKTVSWSSAFVNEIKRGLGACRVFLAFIIFYVCFDQMQNNLISQAGQMNTGSTPNDVLPAMNQVGCILISPVVAKLNPLLARRNIYLKPVVRITIGFVFITLSMLYATFVQHAIYSSAPCYDHPRDCGDHQRLEYRQDRPHVWIQAPVYFLMAAGEVFAMTTAMEYAEKHAPKHMEVLVQAICMLITGLGSAIALVIAEAAFDPYLTYFYASLTSGMAATTIIFWGVFRKYDQDDVAVSRDTSSDLEKGDHHREIYAPSSCGSDVSPVTTQRSGTNTQSAVLLDAQTTVASLRNVPTVQ